jgi:hypothetical protein
MDEENIAQADPDETEADVDFGEIDADWNNLPEDKLGADTPEDEDEQGQGSGTDSAAEGGKTDAGIDRREADQSFTLKHLSEVKTVGRDEVVALAQKGMDYDRIRGKYDEANAELAKSGDAAALVKELAALQGITAEQLIDAARVQMLVQKHGVQPEYAIEQVGAMRDQRNGMEPAMRDKTPDEIAVERAFTEKRHNDISEFFAEYGIGIDPKSIPPEVWRSVESGKTLLSAYQAWELKKLRLESSASKKNAENKTRSAGSRQTAGYRQRDEITDSWYDD